MIYKDFKSQFDAEACPEPRASEKCINCNLAWGAHNGWNCDSGSKFFKDCSEDKRYLTKSMLSSLGKPVAAIVRDHLLESAQKNAASVPEEGWRMWAHNVQGDCACGIRREQCEFHR